MENNNIDIKLEKMIEKMTKDYEDKKKALNRHRRKHLHIKLRKRINRK